jgi:hypothetical protein
MTTIITKNSSTASAAPAAGDLTKGELAVNVTDKKIYTKDNSATVVKLVGSLGNQEANAVAITGGTVTGITDITVADGGTGASTAANARTNLSAAASGANSDITSLTGLTTALTVAQGGTGVTTSTGTGNVVLSTSPTLVTPALGTPASGVATNLTGLPISTGVSGLGTGIATFLSTPSSANLAAALTDETGTGANVFATSPTLVTPALGTPSALVGTNITGTAAGLTAGNVTTNANLTGAVTSTGNATSLGSFTSSQLATALTDETGSGSAVFATSPTLVTPVLGTPTSATLTNATGLPLSTGVTGTLPIANGGSGQTTATAAFNALAPSQATNSGKYLTTDGTNSSWATVSSGSGTVTSVAVSGGTTGLTTSGGPVTTSGTITLAGTLAVANGGTGVTASTGSGNNVLSTSPTLVTPILGTPTSVTLTNGTGLPLTTGVTGNLPVTNLNSGTSASASTFWRGDGAWAAPSGGGIAYTAVKTANYTAANNDGVLTNTTGGAFTVTLPTSPSVGNIIVVIDSLSQWGTNNLTIDPTALIKIAGNTAGDTLVCDITGATVTLVYTGATYGWNVAAQVGGNGGTAVTLTGTQTLTNKTLTSPVLTAPVLGTPASGTLTNATGLPLTTGVTGTLPVANGGTNLTSFTANGIVYATSSSALTTGTALNFDGANFGVGMTSATRRLAVKQTTTEWIAEFQQTNASIAGGGLILNYTSASPNNTASEFLYCSDSTANRMIVRSNGGIANYSGNNVNLSDRREKTNFSPATSYLDKICAIPVQTFNYIDQNMEDDGGLTLGVVAQDVQAVAPELVMESNWAGKDEEPKMRLSIYQTDLQYALMKCIQEQQALITTLTERITALEGV